MTMIICFVGMLCIFSVCMMKKKAMGAKKMLSAGMIGILCVMNTSCASARIVFEEVALETEIDENGFEWVKGTKILNGYYGEEVNVVIPEGCTEIRWLAFQTEEGKRIKSVTIPASVQELYREGFPGIFENCDNLEEIVIAEENYRYIVVAGEIRYRYKFDNYAGDKGRREVGYREALQKGEVVFRATWPEDKEVIENSKGILEKLNISEGTTEIEDRAFQYFEGLGYVTIPEGVKRIGEENFVGIPGFGVIVFPRSVEEVGWNTFYKSWALDAIIMIGKTQKEMEEILKLTAYDSGPNAKNVKLYTGLDLYLNGEKVDFDYTAPYIDERGTVKIPMIYVLNAAGIPSVNEITLEEVEAENWDIVYRLHMKKDGKEIAVTMSKVEANDVFGVISFTLDESKKILDLFDMEIKYDKKNYRLDVVSK